MTHPLDDVTPLTWRRARQEDLPSLYELLEAVAYMDETPTSATPSDLETIFASARDRDDCILDIGFDAHSAIAMAWLVSSDPPVGGTGDWHARMMVELHPTHRHQNIGIRMITWLVRTAREMFTTLPGADLDSARTMNVWSLSDLRDERRQILFGEAGMEANRWFFDLHHRLEPGPWTEPLPLPEGLTLEPFQPGLAEVVRATHNRAFATEPGARTIDSTSWFVSLSRPDARPEWSWVVRDAAGGGEVVGYALNSVVEWSAEEREGWTDRIGVVPDHRGHGVAHALLAASLRSFRAAGMTGGGLGVDSGRGVGALGLYRSVGYQSTDTIVQFGLTESVAEAIERLGNSTA